MEDANFSKPENGKSSLEQSEVSADNFFPYLRHCSQGISSGRLNGDGQV